MRPSQSSQCSQMERHATCTLDLVLQQDHSAWSKGIFEVLNCHRILNRVWAYVESRTPPFVLSDVYNTIDVDAHQTRNGWPILGLAGVAGRFPGCSSTVDVVWPNFHLFAMGWWEFFFFLGPCKNIPSLHAVGPVGNLSSMS